MCADGILVAIFYHRLTNLITCQAYILILLKSTSVDQTVSVSVHFNILPGVIFYTSNVQLLIWHFLFTGAQFYDLWFMNIYSNFSEMNFAFR